MRRFLPVIAGLLLAVLAAFLLALRSEPFVLGAAHWAVATFSDLRLELRNPRVDFYGGTLSADEIHLVPAAGDGPALLSVLGLSAHIPLPRLVGGDGNGSFLRAGSVQVYLSDSDQTADPEPMQWLGYLGWLPQELRIEQVHLVTASANTWIFPLKSVHGDRLEQSHYVLGAQADYDGEPLGATVDLVAVDDGWGVTSAQARIKLTAPASGSEFTLDGTLEGTANEFRYSFALNAFYRDIRDFLRGFEGGADLAGELRLQGTMVGDTGGFVLSDATFLLNNTPDYAFQASGRLEYRFSGETALELQALGEMASLSYLVDWVDLDVADFGRARSRIRLSGSLDRPVIDEFTLTTGNDAGLTVSMSGRLDLFEAGGEEAPESNAIALEMQGPSLAVLQRWLGEIPVDPGPWRVSGQLTGGRGSLSLQDLVLLAGATDAMELHATGAVGRITTPGSPDGQYAFEDIRLSLRVRVPDSAELGILLGRDDIPAHHELDASVTISGSGEELALGDGRLTIATGDLQARLGPLSAVLRPLETPPLSGLSGPLVIELVDTTALSRYSAPYTPRPIPALGPMTITGRLAQKGELFQLLDLVGAIGAGDPDIRLKGHIGDIATLGDVVMAARVSALDTRKVLAILRPDFAYKGPVGTVAGSFRLAESQGVWTLSKLKLAGGGDRLPLSFRVEGEVADLTGLLTADLGARFRLADPDLLEALGGPPLASLSGSLSIATTQQELRGTFEARAGETQLNGDARVALGENGIQGVRLALDTPHLYLRDFGLQRRQDGPGAQQAGPPEAAPGDDKPADFLAGLRRNAPSFPVDLTVKIDGMSGDHSHIDSLQVHLTGIDNRYTLEQFSASYDQALAEIRGIIDLNPDPPALSLAGEANALPLGAILTDLGIDANVSGALTVLGGITVMGDSAQALLGNLHGSVALALENAVIEGAAYDLLATDLLAWIYSGALTEKSTHLDCAMARFHLRQGVATTDSLYIESAKMVATGKAEFDLAGNRMDLRLTPLSKSRLLQVPSEVRLKGEISNPRAEISAVSAVADATASALTLIPELTLKLFGVNRGATGNYRPCQAYLGN